VDHVSPDEGIVTNLFLVAGISIFWRSTKRRLFSWGVQWCIKDLLRSCLLCMETGSHPTGDVPTLVTLHLHTHAALHRWNSNRERSAHGGYGRERARAWSRGQVRRDAHVDEPPSWTRNWTKDDARKSSLMATTSRYASWQLWRRSIWAELGLFAASRQYCQLSRGYSQPVP
jgi:hypothetical protein